MSENPQCLMKPSPVVAVIPARGGSKGIPRKNLALLAGKPLIVHTIEQAKASACVATTLVSTDDDEIASVSEAAGATVIRRPADLSGDKASSESALIHVLHALAQQGNAQPELMIFLQCTSPIRQARDIDNAVDTLLRKGADSLLSVSPSHRFLWEEEHGIARSINYDFRHRLRRQDMAPQYVENGSIYVFRTRALLDSGNRLSGRVALYPMDDEAAVEIDSPLDMAIVELIMRNRAPAKGRGQ
jgi:CMP-N,N'-diacetyllegionaminic acid synthase